MTPEQKARDKRQQHEAELFRVYGSDWYYDHELSSDEVRELNRLRGSGVSISHLSSIFRVSEATIRSILDA